ncbi:DUF2273 domain-containing protein [Flexivirga meconopsidis]|uniref:DUF2273 domain-containing protein n=1 Tax=Flexivirga meconopsidis TaxID=2977121 RepID=UPI00224063F1|nr:DUF2273 domain-containing protein [Flexivirga meconopsidis]
MTASTTGLFAGLLLTIAIVAGGWVGLLLAIVLGGGGYLVGGHVGGELDLTALWNRRG